MRLQNKYKKFSKLSLLFSEFPGRVLKFHRTKWKKIQQFILKKKKSKLTFSSIKTLLYTKRWLFYKSKYATGVQTKRYFDCIFDKAFSLLYFKKLKYLNKNLDNIVEYAIYHIRPEFRLDIFLWRLNFFSTCYEARHAINNRKIRINNNLTLPNYVLKKGDVINIVFELYHSNLMYKKFFLKKLNNIKFLTFIEIDYYTNTFIILKNYNELTQKDIMFFNRNYINIANYKLFIE